MLETLLLAAIVAAPVGSASLFLPGRRRTRKAGAWSAIRRLVLAVVGTVILAAVVAGALKLLGVSQSNLIAAVAGLVFASLVWLPVTRRWNARAHLAWASTVFLFIVYLAYALDWTFNSHLGAASTAGGLLLWVFEVFAALLCCAYLWEICDALGTEHWRRRITPQMSFGTDVTKLPMVSLHVPAHNEPPDMVIDTLRALLRLDYPSYEVICIDDNTDDERLWRPVQEWCARHGVKFEHLENWPGYKSGALNYALRNMTDPGAGIIGVVDSDYQIEPGFLRRCAPAFADPWIGFVQSPQDYRGWQEAPYYRRLYYSYKYFFAVSQPARNEHDGAIFAGTMGLIRRVALEQLGGWDEWCITEDAELSLRLLRAGWHGLHVDQSWGYGIMPLTFEALKGQRYRWCFGGIQILRLHWRSLLPGRPTRANHLTNAQRWSYLAGGIQWYDQPGHRRGRAVPQTHDLPGRRGAGDGGARAGPRDNAPAPGDGSVVARRDRRLLHLAVHVGGCRAGVGARPVRPQGGVPADAQDERAGQVVGGAAGELGRVIAGRARPGRHRRRADQVVPAERAAAGGAAAVPHPGLRGGAVQQLGRAAGHPAGVAA
jgi:hypothetical protein